MQSNIRKYKSSSVDFDLTTTSIEQNPELGGIIAAIHEAKELTDNIITEFIEVDESIRNFKETVYEAADGIMSLSSDIVEYATKKKSKTKEDQDADAMILLGGVAVAGVGLVAKGIGWGISEIRKYRAERQKEKMLAAIKNKKEEIVKVKYKPIRSFRDKFAANVVSRLEKNYKSEFEKVVSADDAMLKPKLMLFKNSLGLLVKSRFILSALDYLISEMDAWKNGLEDSILKPMSAVNVLDEELNKWIEALGRKGQSWNEFVESWLKRQVSEYPVPIAALFVDSALFSNYVGINLSEVNNCQTAVIRSNYADLGINKYPSFKLLRQNPYVIDCQESVKLNWNIPQPPAGFGLADFTLIALMLAVATSITFATFIYLPGIIIRTIAVLVSLCIILIFSSAFFGEMDDMPGLRLPYIKREDKYLRIFKDTVTRIGERERKFRTKHNQVII